MIIICTHPNADFDAIASVLGAYKLFPDAIPVLPKKLNRNVADFLALYQNGLPFLREEDLKVQSISHLIVTDTHRIPDWPAVTPQTAITIFDHHPLQRELGAHEVWHGEPLGSATTLLVERIQQQLIALNSLEATLLAIGIYEDTGMFTYGTTTARDMQAGAWLLAHGADIDTIRRWMTTPLSDDQQALFEILLQSAETRTVQGYAITVATATMDKYIEGINSVTHRLRDLIDSAAIFIVVQMPTVVQLVARSSEDALDVGEIARQFGGGGHKRAAAASIREVPLDQITPRLWAILVENIHPPTRIAEIMSYSVQTVAAQDRLGDIIHTIRRIGHEGYPVVEDGHVVGLLTRRDADRAIEHGLSRLQVRDVMMAGAYTLSPDDSVSALEQIIVESGWGQIPVVHQDRLLGIVTRTDLITYWARVHPSVAMPQNTFPREQANRVLGDALYQLLERISNKAQAMNVALYLVGGVVRDLMLGIKSVDIDFVVEGDAIAFAQRMAEDLGGDINAFRPFGTAKWTLPKALSSMGTMPKYIDFATARYEFYEHPTALPTVYSSSIKLDLLRRDFTINTLAIQLSPSSVHWRLLDFYGGQNDLQNRLIRVLHSLSFVDDPTRILRAVRFGERLQFIIEPRTAELLSTGLPMLRRITGERIRNELDLLLQEHHPEKGILKLEALGALEAIHPAFRAHPDIRFAFERARQRWQKETINDLYWHILLGYLSPLDTENIGERLLFGKPKIRSFTLTAQLYQESAWFSENHPPSAIVAHLEPIPDVAIAAFYAMVSDATIHAQLNNYQQVWRHVQAKTSGDTLKAYGLKPGPLFRRILGELRAARIDGIINTDDEEAQLLVELIQKWVKADDRY